MLTIKFYKGEEKDVVREENLADSIFHEQYDRAMMLVREFVSSPSDEGSGDKGSGDRYLNHLYTNKKWGGRTS